MGHLGLEPRTNRLKVEYSTIELATLDMRNSIINISKYQRISYKKFVYNQIKKFLILNLK